MVPTAANQLAKLFTHSQVVQAPMLFGNIVSLCNWIYELSRPHSRRNGLLCLADGVGVDRRDFYKINLWLY
jgi:hypothetical protein